MKGTDCTPEQLASADEFVAGAGWGAAPAVAEVKRSEIVRLVAWYGALRFVAGRDGIGGTLERPGPMDRKKSRQKGRK